MKMLDGLNEHGHLNICLADDDRDDCAFFKEALEELLFNATLTIVHNGEQLMKLLHTEASPLPDIIFLDLNMPRKSGLQCLEEIKQDANLKALAVIIYSTSYDLHMADVLCRNGANHFICKPNDFSSLKDVIRQALMLSLEEIITRPLETNFVLGKK